MVQLGKVDTGRFCWVDLAATDADSAKSFYEELFGWTAHEQPANGGSFTRLRMSDRDVGSIYQLRDALLEHGIPSHWTPYVRVSDVNETVRRATTLGGTVIAQPFAVSGIARIALILDSVGALIGLWEPIELDMTANSQG
jgi:predicted enzyme related to lactoylglutathione lyase